MSIQAKNNIVVVGSLNADLVQRVARFPRPGETIVGSDLDIVPGGKGANQACAAGLAGGRVSMIGQVGKDPFGPVLIESLKKANVEVSHIRSSATATGTAAILVLGTGENVIVISPGANASLTTEAVQGRLDQIGKGSLLLTQLEVPLETTQFCLEYARRCGATSILDPAPAQNLSSEVLQLVDFLTPNQTEATLLLGLDREIETCEEAEQAAQELRRRGPSTVIVKMGHLGVVIGNASGCERVKTFPVEAIDSTAAGDTFNGAFAAALAEGTSVAEAARFGNAAAAISVTRQGAQSSIPHRAEIERLLAASNSLPIRT